MGLQGHIITEASQEYQQEQIQGYQAKQTAVDFTPSLSFILSDIEFILEELVAARSRFSNAPEGSIEAQFHFSTQIALAINKAEEYYNKLNQSPAYLAALVLHPRYNWAAVEEHWTKKPQWIRLGRQAVKDL
jgi:hypothetical protein